MGELAIMVGVYRLVSCTEEPEFTKISSKILNYFKDMEIAFKLKYFKLSKCARVLVYIHW